MGQHVEYPTAVSLKKNMTSWPGCGRCGSTCDQVVFRLFPIPSTLVMDRQEKSVT